MEKLSPSEYDPPSELDALKEEAAEKIYYLVDAALSLRGGREMFEHEKKDIDELFLKIDACAEADEMRNIINEIDEKSTNVLSHVRLNDQPSPNAIKGQKVRENVLRRMAKTEWQNPSN